MSEETAERIANSLELIAERLGFITAAVERAEKENS